MTNLTAIGRATLERYVLALQYPDFRTMWLANLSAQAAHWALIVTRGWLVFDMTHSSAMVGVVTFAAMAPLLVIPPLAGVLADRIDRRTLLAWTYALNMAHNLVLALLALTGAIETWQIVALSLVNGIARATQMPVSQALAANLVPKDRLLNALSLNAATAHGARLLGPALVTPLLTLVGVPAAFLFCTAFYGVGWVQVLHIKTRSSGGIKKGESLLASLGGGLRYVGTQPLIRMVLGMVFFHCGLTMAFESLLPNFSSQRFQTGAIGFSSLMMAVGAGALVGSVFIGGIQSPLARGRLYLAMGLASGLGQVMLSFAPNMAWALAAAAVMGGSQAAFMTMGQAVTQSLAADEYRGRIASLNTLSLGGVMSLMNLANGFMGNEFSAASLLLVQGLAFAGIMVASIALVTPRRVYVQGLPEETRRVGAPAA